MKIKKHFLKITMIKVLIPKLSMIRLIYLRIKTQTGKQKPLTMLAVGYKLLTTVKINNHKNKQNKGNNLKWQTIKL